MNASSAGNLISYLAPENFLTELKEELGERVSDVYGRLVVATRSSAPVAWAANTWCDPARIAISSIGDAAKKLRSLQRNWALYSFGFHRRAALIAEQLPRVSAKPMVFGAPLPTAALGSWTLIDADTMLASPSCSSPFPNGEVRFVEDREGPPNRAYLKLWELFTILGERPNHGEFCIDLGASPGGWSWVVQQLGARVMSIDKAPLDARVARLPGIEYRGGDAFALDPSTLGAIDWLFSDVACYPAKLLALVQRWLAAGNVRRFVCTIKFQGATDFQTMRQFAAIPGSRLLHLYHNKHELTWLKL